MYMKKKKDKKKKKKKTKKKKYQFIRSSYLLAGNVGGLNKMKKTILNALEKRYEAIIAESDATLNIYLNNSVGIGEHPQHIDEVDKLIDKIANAEEKLKILKEFE